MEIKTYRVPQLMSKPITVITVDDTPICAVRGKKSTSDIIAKLSGYDVKIIDGRIDKKIDQILRGKSNGDN